MKYLETNIFWRRAYAFDNITEILRNDLSYVFEGDNDVYIMVHDKDLDLPNYFKSFNNGLMTMHIDMAIPQELKCISTVT